MLSIPTPYPNFLNYLATISHSGKQQLSKFIDFLQSSVITYYKRGGSLYKHQGLSTQSKQIDQQSLSGLGLYIPESKSAISRYRSFDLYKVIDLITLYSNLLNFETFETLTLDSMRKQLKWQLKLINITI